MLITRLKINDLAATKRLGVFLADRLQGSDVLALQGGLGAGKSELARAIIGHLCPDEDDIPSPTFTLVQTYETADKAPILHFDLYRLEAPEDALELGIEDAFVEAICLIEWSERLVNYLPESALTLVIEQAPDDADARVISLFGDANWQPRLDGIGDN